MRDVTIVVAKPWCTPARDHVATALDPCHVRWHSREKVEHVGSTPYRIKAWVTVPPQQAVFAEYLLLRSQKFELLSPLLHPKNKQWADKHQGVMPMPWDVLTGRAEPWVEPECDVSADGSRPKKGSVVKGHDAPPINDRRERRRARRDRAPRTRRRRNR